MRRAPFSPIGFFVTWQTIVWPGREQVLDPVGAGLALDVVAVVGDVAPVQDRVLRRADVDEGRFHARQHVLHPAPVDVADDLVGVVLRPGDEVLDERPALEHGDLGRPGLDVHAHEVATDRPAAAVPAPPGQVVEALRAVGVDERRAPRRLARRSESSAAARRGPGSATPSAAAAARPERHQPCFEVRGLPSAGLPLLPPPGALPGPSPLPPGRSDRRPARRCA